MPRIIAGQRGVLFTFLTFLFIGVILGLVVFNSQLSTRAANSTVEVSVLSAINAKYDDITDDIVVLDNAIGVPTIQQRILPFTYRTDSNAISITQTLPIASGKLALYYDLINAYAVFVNDQNVQRTYDGVNVNLHVPKSPAWGGPSQHAEFNILPQCAQYILTDSNEVRLENPNTIGCSSPFNVDTAIAYIDINISLPTSVDDYSQVSCSFDGNSACPHQDYNATNGPFLRIRFLDSNCSACTIPSIDHNITTSFNGSSNGSVIYSCTSSSCASSPITLTTSNGFRLIHDGVPIVASMKITFTDEVSMVYFQDANYTVTKSGFNTSKSNVVVFPK